MKISKVLWVMMLGSLLASCGGNASASSSSKSESAFSSSNSSVSASSSQDSDVSSIDSSSASVPSQSQDSSTDSKPEQTIGLDDLEAASAKAKEKIQAVCGGTVTLDETSSYSGPTQKVMPFEYGVDKNGDVLHYVDFDWEMKKTDAYVMKNKEGSIIAVTKDGEGNISKQYQEFADVQFAYRDILGYGFDYYGAEGLLDGLLATAKQNVNKDAKFSFEDGQYKFSFGYFSSLDTYEFYVVNASFALGEENELKSMGVKVASYGSSAFIVDDELQTIQLLDDTTPNSTKEYAITQTLGDRAFQNPIHLDDFYATSFDLIYNDKTIVDGETIQIEVGSDASLDLSNVAPATTNFDFDSIEVSVTEGDETSLSGSFNSFSKQISLSSSNEGNYTLQIKSTNVTKNINVTVLPAQPKQINVSYFVEGPDGYTAYPYSGKIDGYVGVSYIIAATVSPDAASQELSVALEGNVSLDDYTIEKKQIQVNEWAPARVMYLFTPLKAGDFDVKFTSVANTEVSTTVHVSAKEAPSLKTVLSDDFAWKQGGAIKYYVAFEPSEDGLTGNMVITDRTSNKAEAASYILTKGEKYYEFALTHVSGESFNLAFKMSFDFTLFLFGEDGFANQMSKVTPEFLIAGSYGATSGDYNFTITFFDGGEASFLFNKTDFSASGYFSCSYSLMANGEAGYTGELLASTDTTDPFISLPLSFSADKEFTEIRCSFVYQETNYALSFVSESY